MDGLRELKKRLTGLTGGRLHTWDVWSDWVSMMAIAIANPVDRRPDVLAAREAEYMRMVGRYEGDEPTALGEMMGVLTLELEEEPRDVLGELFMRLEFGNKWRGQVFTPMALARLMAELNLDEVLVERARADFITVNEPAVGAGAMVIAFAEALRARGVDPTQHLHVTAQDIDRRAVAMSYVQLSLLGIPAVVIQGDTLRMTCEEVWYTPAHVLGGWDQPLQAREVAPATEAFREALAAVDELADVPGAEPVQLELLR